jgi:hypothetical protein
MVLHLATGAQEDPDNRLYERRDVELGGKLFFPADQSTLDCRVINLSASGAGLICHTSLPLRTIIVLYIDGFGRFDGVIVRSFEGGLGLQFTFRDAKRQRLIAALAAYAEHGLAEKTSTRRHNRMPFEISFGNLSRCNGENSHCDVLDISVLGLSLRTKARPPVGEIITLGPTHGRVVRHHADGIAIEFVQKALLS